MPKLLHQLDNGLGIYQSSFADIFGSRICYGGTHKSLSKQVNGINFSSVCFLDTLAQVGRQSAQAMEQVNCADEQDLDPEKSVFVQVDSDITYPSQVTARENTVFISQPQPYLDMCTITDGIGNVEVTCTHVCIQNPETRDTYPTVCKAMIPIQRLKELASL